MAITETRALRKYPLAKKAISLLNQVLGTKTGNHNLSLPWNQRIDAKYRFIYPRGIR